MSKATPKPPRRADQRPDVWRRKPQQTRSSNTVNSILIAAEELFAAKGYHNTTSEDIVRRAGIGIGSLYDYFPNKTSIALALLESRSTAIADEARKIFIEYGAQPIEVSLPRVIGGIFQSYKVNRDVFITLVNDVSELRVVSELYSIDRLIHRASLIYLQMYENEFAHHEIHVAHEFLNIMFISSIRHFLSSTTHALEEDAFLEQLTRAILVYVKTPPPPSGDKLGRKPSR